MDPAHERWRAWALSRRPAPKSGNPAPIPVPTDADTLLAANLAAVRANRLANRAEISAEIAPANSAGSEIPYPISEEDEAETLLLLT